MRPFTKEELKKDLFDMKYQFITKKIADRLTQEFHFDTFFKQQIEAWKSMTIEQQTEILDNMTETYGSKYMSSMTYAEFFDKLSRVAHIPRYSTFNVEMMNQLLKKYTPQLVVDPCMGWGHRMLMCLTKDIKYIGIDIRKESIDANTELLNYVNSEMTIPPHKLICGDGKDKINITPDLDNTMLFTCPPYHDSEIYSENGVENSSYKEFLQWWFELAQNAFNNNIETFAYQITPKYGDDMRKLTEKAGYTFEEYIKNTREKQETNHINVRGKVSKRNYGKIYVFTLKQS